MNKFSNNKILKLFGLSAVLITVVGLGYFGFKGYQENIAAEIDDVQIVDADFDLSTLPDQAQIPDDIEELQNLSDEQWQERLDPAAYKVLIEGGTEVPFTSKLLEVMGPGTFVTADCNIPVFRSEQMFETGTGWPSFWAPIDADLIELEPDERFGISRTAVKDSVCNSHLGHVFNDAPETPTGLRYCLNGVALKFIPDAV